MRLRTLESTDRYLDYLLDKVGYKGNALFSNIMYVLLRIEYIPYKGLDSNRAGDGRSLRRAFCLEQLIDFEIFSEEILGTYCSVLEMMVALAIRMEVDIAGDPSGEDRTAHWFDVMLESTGLVNYTGERFNETEVVSIIWKMQNHEYSSNGEGGLFKTADSTIFDMRALEIWSQANAYITVTEG